MKILRFIPITLLLVPLAACSGTGHSTTSCDGTGGASSTSSTTSSSTASSNTSSSNTSSSSNGSTSTASSSTASSGSMPTQYPNDVDCTKAENCYHVTCWDDPNANCGSIPSPGVCPINQVRDITTNTCRDCTADDCDGLPSFCCGSSVCAGTAACGLYLCKEIDASCAGVTSDTCGFHDLDSDDAWGDCDEAPADPCCYCKVALGCSDSPCGVGSYVKNNACTPCSAQTCGHLACMGLNGCPTNCPPKQYFDGVKCRDCSSSDSTDLIPACNGGKTAGDGGTP